MSDWQITLALGLGGGAVGLLYHISAKLEGISRLLHDRALKEHDRYSN